MSLRTRHARRSYFYRFARPTFALLLSLGPLLAGGPRARADQRDFPFTYTWLQATRGEKEIAFHTRYRQRDRLWEHQVELEYGASDRFSIAPYLVFEQGDGRTLHFDAWKLETRYQLGSYRTNTLLPGLYLEYEKPNGEKGEIEGKLILSHFDNRGRELSFNYIVNKELEAGADVEHTYSLGYAVPVGRARAGGELIHELTSGRLLLGPTLFTPLGAGSSMTLGYALPLNSKSDNRAELRLFAQYHWF